MLLTEIPGEVIFNHIFPWLQLNDLLRLRRVSKSLKSLADDYLRVYGISKRYVTVFPEENPSKLVSLKLVVPVTRINISNINSNTWNSKALRAFAKRHGERLTHLRINSLEIPMTSGNAIKFFESFPNLEHLCVTNVHERGYNSRHRRRAKYKEANKLEKFLVPSTFQRLKTLIIIHYMSISEDVESIQLVWQFISECGANLKYVNHPYIIHQQNLNWGDTLGQGLFGCVKNLIERRHETLNTTQPNLKFYDLDDFFVSSQNREFYELVTICSQNNVKLLNVNARLIEDMMEYQTHDMENHCRKISAVVASLHGLHTSSFLLELPHLEKIKIEGHETMYDCSMPQWLFERQPWSELKDLEIWVHAEGRGMETSRLFEFFFGGIKRENMTDLKLQFLCFDHNCQLKDLPCPNIRDVCNSCHNLKSLCIGYWPGSDHEISILWGNLPLLEKVEFQCCKKLGDEAFLGDDPTKPCFFQAKNLKHVHLDGLDRMPRITDNLFTQVLRYMPLKELHLKTTYSGQLGSVTMVGITSLLSGDFAKTIEYFSFADIKMKGVANEELSALESMFRSANM